MSELSTEQPSGSIPFEDLRLRSGTRMKLEATERKSQLEGVFFAALNRRSVFVTLPFNSLKETDMRPGERYRIRGFNGTEDFTFESRIQSLESNPCVHAHFEYPEQVQARKVRADLRVLIEIEAYLLLDMGGAISGRIVNLSLSGALFDTDQAHPESGAAGTLTFLVKLDQDTLEMKLLVQVRHVGAIDSGGHGIGLSFGKIGANEKLILHYLVFSKLEA